MSARSRTKGNRFELEVVHQLQELGLAAEKISGMYVPGGLDEFASGIEDNHDDND